MNNKVPALRIERGLNPTDLHRLTKSLSWPTVLKWSGDNAPLMLDKMDAKTLVELAQALKCQVTDLFEVVA